MRMLYKYPQTEFPYETLVEENGQARQGAIRNSNCSILEHFPANRYFDIFVEYAKADVRGHAHSNHFGESRAGKPPRCTFLPQLWFSKTRGSWGKESGGGPVARKATGRAWKGACVELQHWQYGKALAAVARGQPQLLFTENETNNTRPFRREKKSLNPT